MFSMMWVAFLSQSFLLNASSLQHREPISCTVTLTHTQQPVTCTVTLTHTQQPITCTVTLTYTQLISYTATNQLHCYTVHLHSNQPALLLHCTHTRQPISFTVALTYTATNLLYCNTIHTHSNQSVLLLHCTHTQPISCTVHLHSNQSVVLCTYTATSQLYCAPQQAFVQVSFFWALFLSLFSTVHHSKLSVHLLCVDFLLCTMEKAFHFLVLHFSFKWAQPLFTVPSLGLGLREKGNKIKRRVVQVLTIAWVSPGSG